MTVGGKISQQTQPQETKTNQYQQQKKNNIPWCLIPLLILIVSILIGIYKIYSDTINPLQIFKKLPFIISANSMKFLNFFSKIGQNPINTYMAKIDDRYIHEFEEITEFQDNFPDILNFNQNFLMANEPFICRNCLKQWPAFQKWQSDNYLREKIGNHTVQVEKRLDGSSTFAYFQKEFQEENIPYSQFLDRYQNFTENDRYYYANQPVPDPIKQDIIEPEIGKLMVFEKLNIWQSAGGSESLPHTDAFENFLCQVSGYKDIVLLPPTQRKHLYLQEGVSNYSPINFFNPDYEKYPRFKHAVGKMKIRLNQGDALYLPAYWWHHILSSKKRSIAVNYWYTPAFIANMFFGGIESYEI